MILVPAMRSVRTAVLGLAFLPLGWELRAAEELPSTAPPSNSHVQTVPEAYWDALDLLSDGRAFESLALFAECLPVMDGIWEFHINYSAALQQANVETRPVHGRVEVVMRSTYERVWCMRSALEHLLIAESLAPTEEMRALTLLQQGALLSYLGSPLDALECYERAAAINARFLEEARSYRETLELPCADGSPPTDRGE
jgi:tetratricopeptide (TPR) repeat protein